MKSSLLALWLRKTLVIKPDGRILPRSNFRHDLQSIPDDNYFSTLRTEDEKRILQQGLIEAQTSPDGSHIQTATTARGESIVRAIRYLEGPRLFLIAVFDARPNPREVTENQRDVLIALAAGESPKRIAHRSGRTTAGVQNLIARIRGVFNAQSNEHLIALAIRSGTIR